MGLGDIMRYKTFCVQTIHQHRVTQSSPQSLYRSKLWHLNGCFLNSKVVIVRAIKDCSSQSHKSIIRREAYKLSSLKRHLPVQPWNLDSTAKPVLHTTGLPTRGGFRDLRVRTVVPGGGKAGNVFSGHGMRAGRRKGTQM